MENNTSLQQQLLEAGVHFGHLKKKWNPKMLPYIFAEKKGIHIIDLNKTVDCLQETAAALKQIARSGKKILFVGTKKQAKDIVNECAKRVNMPFVTERWLGGMLTNFNTVRKSVKKMQSIEKMLGDGSFDSITKKERLTLSRDKDKMEKVLGGISQLGRIPAALFLVDIGHEHIALAEAKRLGITTFGLVDTNCDPNKASEQKFIAMSRDLLKRWGGKFDYKQKVKLVGCGDKDGIYIVADCMNERFTNKIDILETIGTPLYKFKSAKIFPL